ncbi:reducing polyketide synthase swnK [Folsomia candida]|uniref:reducing polyketide synthase swnK n=1 Tax=Folsomia candida TaxID=158441 RepID=UPI0016051CC7|nr:reducing polyketide synthase swnK [Folsomia candida]
MMNGTKERTSIWVGAIRKVQEIPWLVETYRKEETAHNNSAVFVGPAISLQECTKLEMIFDFVVTMGEDENPQDCSFRLWDTVTFRIAHDGNSEVPNGMTTSDEESTDQTSENEPIAIIGMACRLPGSNDYHTFWNNLVGGVDSIGEAPKDRFQPERGCVKMTSEHLSTEARYLSCPVDTFDAKFWGISPLELEYTDPQARMVLQLAWEALEDAGIPPSTIHGTDASVLLGFWREDYNDLLVQTGSSAGNELRRYLGCSMGTAAARVAHAFGTTGPALSTETGCSSRVCSIGAAMAALRNNKTGLALAGGANLILKPFLYKEFQGVLSPSGRSKVFHSDADGSARAEGVIMYALKREADARRDGDHIYALLSGYGTSQEGLSRSAGTLTIDGEARAITLALMDACVSPSDIDWLEMHGTGTKVGDPIEVAATRVAYGLDIKKSERRRPLIITSVKANIGHTESVSGAAGLLKVVLGMKYGAIPPQRLNGTLNPKFNLEGIQIPLQLLPWKGKYAGVSSFGITGTNSHLIVQRVSIPRNNKIPQSDTLSAYILPLAAKCASSMAELKKRHVFALQNLDDRQLADYCYTSAVCRDHFKEYRYAVVGRNKMELIQAILSDHAQEPQLKPHKPYENSNSKVCFVFPGQGCQYAVWGAWGIFPSIVLGHSFGEFAASVVAGTLSLPTALELLVASRTKMVGTHDEGGMLFLEDDTKTDTWIDIAALSSCEQTVISSKPDTISKFSMFCTKFGIKNTALHVTHAFHSRALELVLNQFESEAAQLNYPSRKFKSVAYVSSVYGRVVDHDEKLEANYWRKHMRQRVEFIRAAKAALQEQNGQIFLEVGPHPVLCPLVSKIAASGIITATEKPLFFPSLRKGTEDMLTMLDTATLLCTEGVDLDWSTLWKSLTLAPLCKVPSLVPLYAFTSNESFWFSTIPSEKPASFYEEQEVHPLLGSCFPTMVEGSYAFVNSTRRLLANPLSGDWLQDHRLGSHIIFPAAGYAEMVFAAVDIIKRRSNENCATIWN